MPVPSLLDFLRLHNILGGQQQQQDIYGNAVPPPQPMDEIPRSVNISDMPTNAAPDYNYTPSHEASDAYQALINQMPQRNKLGIMRKIGASIVGAGYGPDAAMKAEYAPYYRDVEDWKMKLGPAQQAMTNERSINSQERIASHQEQMSKIQQQNADTREAAQKATAENNAKRTAEYAKRTDAYVLDKMNPNLLKVALPGDTLKFYDPKTGDLVKDTGIDSGSLTDEEKIRMNVKGRLEEIGAQGNETRKTENLRDLHTKENIDLRDKNQQNLTRLRDTIKGPVASHGMTPSAIATDRINRANQFINENPGLAKVIHIDGKNVTVDDAKSGWLGNGLTPQKRDEIMKAIFGTESTSTTNQVPQNTGQKMKVVDKASGKVIGMVPIGDVDKVDKTKYSVQVP